MIAKKLLYKYHSLLILVAFFAAIISVSCTHSQQHDQIISDAERIANEHPDSALALLMAVDPADLTQDSIKAKYYYVLASAHDAQSHIALSDSMISFSNDYYRGKDLKRSIRCGTLLASHKFRIGEKEAALRILDSLSSLNNVPDSLLIEPLCSRIQLWSYDEDNEARIRHLLAIVKDEEQLTQLKFWLYFSLLFNSKSDSALIVIDDLIDHADRPEDRINFTYEK